MRRKDRKTRCEKRMIAKCDDVCRTYDDIQYQAADYLSESEDVKEIRCNVWLDGLGLDAEYTSDFVCVRMDGGLMVRECVFRKHLTKPMTMKLLEESRRYWLKRGCEDWGLIVDAEEK